MYHTFNRDDDMAHLVHPGEPGAPEALFSGHAIGSSVASDVTGFRRRVVSHCPALDPYLILDRVWAGPGTTLWTCLALAEHDPDCPVAAANQGLCDDDPEQPCPHCAAYAQHVREIAARSSVAKEV